MYVYIIAITGRWAVGFYSPDGQWREESDWSTQQDASERVHWLNGGN